MMMMMMMTMTMMMPTRMTSRESLGAGVVGPGALPSQRVLALGVVRLHVLLQLGHVALTADRRALTQVDAQDRVEPAAR